MSIHFEQSSFIDPSLLHQSHPRLTSRSLLRQAALCCLLLLNSGVAWSQEKATITDPSIADSEELEATKKRPALEEVVVFGRGTRLIGVADSASEGSVGGADLLIRPMLRVAELLEVVPGMVAVQH